MPSIRRPRWILTVNGTARTAGHVNLNFVLGPNTTTVADIEIISPMTTTPAVRSMVVLNLGDRDSGLQWPVFKGLVQRPLGVSFPNSVTIQCAGYLSLLRDTWDTDVDFTGDTDGELIKAALTAAGIAFDPDNIQDAGYELGAISDIVAPARQKKSTIVEETNRILFMNLVEIGGEIHRFYVDHIPDADDIVNTYSRGSTHDFAGNERSSGPIDDIINNFIVNGVTYPCGTPVGDPPKPPCRCSIWAKSNGTNTSLGSGVRVEPVPESSPLIQDEDFAIWLADELLRVNNRLPDRITLTTRFDPEYHVGDVFGIFDDIRGIRLNADADDAPYLIERIDVNDFTAIYQLSGPSTSFSRNTSSGVEKQCNSTKSTGPNVSPGFTPPAGWPRILVTPDDWFPCRQPTNPTECDEGPFVSGASVEAGFDWKVSGTVILNSAGDSYKIGIDSDAGQFVLTIGGASFYTAFMLDPQLFEVNVPGDYEHVSGSAPLGQPIGYILQWDESESTLTAWVQVNDEICYTAVIEYSGDPMTGANTIRTLTGAPTHSGEGQKLNCGFDGEGGGGGDCPPMTTPWDEAGATAGVGTWTVAGADIEYSSPGAMGADQGFISTDGAVFVGNPFGPPNVIIQGDFTLGSDDWQILFDVIGDNGFDLTWNFSGRQFNQIPPAVVSPILQVVWLGGSSGSLTDADLSAMDNESPIDFALEFNTTDGVFSLTLSQGANSYTFTHTDAADWQNAGITESFSFLVAFTGQVGAGAVEASSPELNNLQLCGTGTIIGDWVEDVPTFNSTIDSATAIFIGTGHDEGHEIDIEADWTVTATFETSSAGSGSDFLFGVCATNPPFDNFIPVFQARMYVFDSTDTQIDLSTRNTNDFQLGPPFDDGTPMVVAVSWDQSSTTLSVTVTQGARVETFAIVDPDPTDLLGPYFPYFGVDGNPGAEAELTDYEVTQ